MERTKHPTRLILASRSPRRRELLTAAGYEFTVVPPADDAEDDPRDGETPRQMVARLAYQKAADVARRVAAGLVLGCDTVVECDGRLLGKPADAEDARAMLTFLSGREHRVLSGVCLWPVPGAGKGTVPFSLTRKSGQPPGTGKGDSPIFAGAKIGTVPEPVVRVAETTLQMDRLEPAWLDAYIAGGQWQGKAGSFGYQDGLDWVHVVEGSESNVVGLPLELLAEMLEGLGTRG
jgi:septum formation protein